MPRVGQQTISWQQIRALTEVWTWRDARTGAEVSGFNPPQGAKEVRQKPYYMRAITGKGELIEGMVITLKVYTREHQRMVKFCESNQIRRIRDYLIIEIDGKRVVTH